MLPLFQTFIPHPEIACSAAEFDPAVHKATYRYNYPEIFAYIAANPGKARGVLRSITKNDRFFIVHFIMNIPKANHPFIVDRCNMCQDGRQSGTVDIWAREHFKSTIQTVAGTIQRILNNPECTTVIFSYKKPAAEKFLDAIRKILEQPFMVWLFPDILYEKPSTESPSWSLQGGIRVKRHNTSRKEHTVEACGLVEGMPTGGHWDHRFYDDCETADLALNPDQLQLCYERFEMSRNLGTEGGTEQIIGTYYSHSGVLVKMGEKRNIHGNPMYELRIIPATDDGTINGKPVFFSQEYLDDKKTDSTFNTQQLCNPTPVTDIKLHYSRFQFIEPRKMPKNRIKFVIIDPAGDDDVQSGVGNDEWAMGCISVEPCIDDLGLSNVYVEEIIADQMGLSAAIDAACTLYMKNGRIAVLGVEKVANDTTYRHIQTALRAAGRYLHLRTKGKRGGNLQLLSPSGRSKNYRIETALTWPLNNARIHLSTALPPEILDKLKNECDKFPFFHVDILDMLAYLYDILKDFEFELQDDDEDEEETGGFVASGRSAIGGY